MIVREFSNAYAITAGPDPVREGTVGLWFTAAGTATVTTKSGDVVTVGGVVGSCFRCPIKLVTAVGGGASLLGLLGS